MERCGLRDGTEMYPSQSNVRITNTRNYAGDNGVHPGLLLCVPPPMSRLIAPGWHTPSRD